MRAIRDSAGAGDTQQGSAGEVHEAASEHYYRRLLETSLEGVWVIDADGRTTFANPRMAEMLGRSVEELMGRSFLDFMPEDCRAEARSKLERRRSGVREVHRFRLRRADGSDVWTEMATSPLVDEDGRFLGALAMVADRTKSKEAEESLAESMNLTRSVIDGTTDAVFVKDRQGRYVFINTAGAGFAGLLPENVVGKDDTAFFGAETARALRENDANVMRSGKTSTYEEVAIAKDGVRHVFSVTKAPWRDTAGRVIGLIGIARDVTERRRIEDEQRLLAEVSDALARSIDFEDTLQRVANLLVPRLADWCFVDWVEEGAFRTAIAHEDPARLEVMRRLLDLYVVPRDGLTTNIRGRVFRTTKAETGEATEALMASIVDEGDHLDDLRAMGLRFYAIVPLLVRGRAVGVMTLLSAKSGRRYGGEDVAVASEIGRRAAMAIENARLYRDAQRAIVARNDLLAMVAHDLRNPLNVLLLRATILLRQWPEEQPGQFHIEAIQRLAKQMAVLTSELLDVSSLEAGHLVLERSPSEPRRLVDELVDQFGPVAEQKALRLVTEVEPHLPELLCDRGRVYRVLVNLMDNAVKFTPKEGVITVRAEKHGSSIWFSVTDTGPGIPEEQLQHIFDRYSQPAGAARGGAGLGLFIAKGIVEAHGGRISAKARTGEGTTFRFTVPLIERSNERIRQPYVEG
jgi:PAS domain S-box-containing protein